MGFDFYFAASKLRRYSQDGWDHTNPAYLAMHWDCSYSGFEIIEMLLNHAGVLDHSPEGVRLDTLAPVTREDVEAYFKAPHSAIVEQGLQEEWAIVLDPADTSAWAEHCREGQALLGAVSRNEHQVWAMKFSNSNGWRLDPGECLLLARSLSDQLQTRDHRAIIRAWWRDLWGRSYVQSRNVDMRWQRQKIASFAVFCAQAAEHGGLWVC